MKQKTSFAAAGILACAVAALPLGATPSVAAAKIHKEVVIEHPKHHARGNVVHMRRVVVAHPRRPGQFWHRGSWHVRVHGPVYRWPHGWHYRRWAIGSILPTVFFVPDYFYDDYAVLGLQTPPPGYRWVRYGGDLLLVNLRTGEVEDVVYDVFD